MTSNTNLAMLWASYRYDMVVRYVVDKAKSLRGSETKNKNRGKVKKQLWFEIVTQATRLRAGENTPALFDLVFKDKSMAKLAEGTKAELISLYNDMMEVQNVISKTWDIENVLPKKFLQSDKFMKKLKKYLDRSCYTTTYHKTKVKAKEKEEKEKTAKAVAEQARTRDAKYKEIADTFPDWDFTNPNFKPQQQTEKILYEIITKAMREEDMGTLAAILHNIGAIKAEAGLESEDDDDNDESDVEEQETSSESERSHTDMDDEEDK